MATIGKTHEVQGAKSETRAMIAGLVAVALAVLFLGCATATNVYVKPGQDFSVYKEIAVASFASDRQKPETAKGAAELPAFLYAVMSAKGYSVIDVQRSVEEVKKLAPPDKELTPETLEALGKALKVNAVMGGIVKEYGEYEEYIPAEMGTTTRAGGMSSSATQRRLGFHTQSGSRVTPEFTSSGGETVKVYKVTVRLQLFDVASKTVVWWGEATAGGEQDQMKTYANAVFEALLKKLPARPHRPK